MGHAYVLYGATHAKKNNPLPKFGSWVASLFSGLFPAAVTEASSSKAAKVAFNEVKPSDYEITEVKLADPWDGEFKTLPFAEFKKRLDFAISRTTAREQLERWRKLAKVEKK